MKVKGLYPPASNKRIRNSLTLISLALPMSRYNANGTLFVGVSNHEREAWLANEGQLIIAAGLE
jgi:hypothetical protein